MNHKIIIIINKKSMILSWEHTRKSRKNSEYYITISKGEGKIKERVNERVRTR